MNKDIYISPEIAVESDLLLCNILEESPNGNLGDMPGDDIFSN